MRNKKVKKVKKGKSIGYFLTIPAVILGLLSIYLYTQNGVTVFSPKLDNNVILVFGIATALSAINLLVEWKGFKYLSYLTFLYALILFIGTQVNYITNVFVSIDGYTFSDGFIRTLGVMIVTVVMQLLAAVTTKKRRKGGRK